MLSISTQEYMHMTTAPAPQDMAIPIEFKWATFCRALYTDPQSAELAVINPLLNLNLNVQVLSEPKAPADLPLGAFTLLGVFKRKGGSDGALSVPVDVHISWPGYSFGGPVSVDFKPSIMVSQLIFKIPDIILKQVKYWETNKMTIVASFVWEGHELGKAEIELGIGYVELQEQKKNATS